MRNRFQTIARSCKIFSLLVAAMSLVTLQSGAPLAAATARAQDDADQRAHAKAAAKIKAQAARYDHAIRTVEAVERMSLNTADDVKNVVAELQRGGRGLDSAFSKAVKVALDNPALKAGVEAEADRITPKAMSMQIRQTPTFARRISGFSEAKSAIIRQFESDAALLRRVARKLQDASRRRGASVPAPSTESRPDMVARAGYRRTDALAFTPASFAPTSYVSPSPAAEPAAVQTGLLEVAVTGAIVLIIGAYAARKAADFTEAEDPDNEEDTRTRFRVCMDNANAKLDTCLEKKEGDFFGQTGCWAVYLFEKAECLTVPL